MTQLSTATVPMPEAASRAVLPAMRRGFLGRCPRCGEGTIFCAYLKVNDACPVCGEALHHQRADDAPPYVTLLIVCHVLIAFYLLAEDHGPAMPAWVEIVIFCALGAAMAMALLPRVKGALIGLQWALRMHGFHGPNGDADPHARPAPDRTGQGDPART